VENVTGREVATLVDGLRAAGWHETTFDAANISSGIYFFRMSAGRFTGVKKLIVVK